MINSQYPCFKALWLLILAMVLSFSPLSLCNSKEIPKTMPLYDFRQVTIIHFIINILI